MSNLFFYSVILFAAFFHYEHVMAGEESSSFQELYDSKNSSEVLRYMLEENRYDKRMRPKFEGSSVLVNLSVFISSIGSLNSKEMEFTVSLFVRQIWHDPRLAYGNKYTLKSPLSIGIPIIDQIWKPDTYIANEKDKVAPKDQFLITINKNGLVVYSQRMTVKASCHMDLHFFPMDEQECSLFFGSYGFSKSDVDFGWVNGNKSVSVSSSLSMSQFELQEYYVKRHETIYAVTGTFVELEMAVKLKRKSFPYIVQTYIPSILIVVLSWVTFWIPRSSPPARVALGITTVLSITTLTFSVQSSLPKVSYVKGIDWFLMVSFCYVFLALLEYPSAQALNKCARKIPPLVIKAWKSLTRSSQIYVQDDGESRTHRNNEIKDQQNTEQTNETVSEKVDEDVDRLARIIFPLSFFFYNLSYWIVYQYEIEVIPQ